jgi:thioredoxin 1
MNDSIRAVTDANFGDEVLTATEPVLVDFWATWCTPCKLMAPVVADSAASYAGRLKVVKIDVDDNPAAASRYRVRSIPTLVLFKAGAPVASQVGTVSKAQLASFVEPHL